MADPKIVQSVLRFRNSLLNAERQSAVRLVNAYGGIYGKLQDKIAALELDITELGEAPTRGQVIRLARYKELLQQTAEEMDKYSAVLENEVSLMRSKAIDDATSQARQVVQQALPNMPQQMRDVITARFNRLPRASIESMLGALQPSSPLADLLNEFGTKAAQSLGDTILEGVALGYNPRKIASMIQNTMGGNLTRALTVSRTETLRAYRGASLANYRANSDIVKGWVWTAAKDSRTCLACLALDGKEFGHDQTYVPAHPNCRCAPRPKTVTYAELGLNVAEPKDEYQKASDWFMTLPPAEQRAAMGKEAYKLFSDGKVKLDDFIGMQKSRTWGDAYIQKSLKDILASAA